MTAGAMVELESVLSEARPVDRPLDFLNNEFVPSLTDETMDVVNPATGRNIGIVSAVEGTDRAIAAARGAFRSWRLTTPTQRADMMFAITDTRNKHVMIKQ
jgi:acyl-CoA reductase-like NAD-dependent aldehyde dehydrogenase